MDSIVRVRYREDSIIGMREYGVFEIAWLLLSRSVRSIVLINNSHLPPRHLHLLLPLPPPTYTNMGDHKYLL